MSSNRASQLLFRAFDDSIPHAMRSHRECVAEQLKQILGKAACTRPAA
jgi:hypothetical protein